MDPPSLLQSMESKFKNVILVCHDEHEKFIIHNPMPADRNYHLPNPMPLKGFGKATLRARFEIQVHPELWIVFNKNSIKAFAERRLFSERSPCH